MGATLPGGITPAKAFGEKSSALDLHETEKRLIMQALATTNGNITEAAQQLGISRRTLHRKINEMKGGRGNRRDGSGRRAAATVRSLGRAQSAVPT